MFLTICGWISAIAIGFSCVINGINIYRSNKVRDIIGHLITFILMVITEYYITTNLLK